MFRYKLAEMARPFLLRTPRGNGFLYAHILGPTLGTYLGDDFLRKNLRQRFKVFHSRPLDAYIIVDLGDWACRSHYFQGRFHDRVVPLLIDKFLSEGGTFVDVGANRGIHSVYAAKKLGDRGSIFSFEPNPQTFKILEAHRVINNLSNMVLYNMGLSDGPGTLELYGWEDQHSGTCSFLKHDEPREVYEVPVSTLEALGQQVRFTGNTLIKVDTEGFEYRALKGMGDMLNHPEAIVISEVTDEWLRKSGSSTQELFDFMTELGFSTYVPTVSHRFLSERLSLSPIDSPLDDYQYNVVFVRPDFLRRQNEER